MSQAVATVTGQQERPIGFLGLMRNRNYALLWWGQLVSELGNKFHWIAISLWVYSFTHSASAVSLAVAATFVGNLLVSLWAGVLVDWFDRKRILVISDFARAILVALIPALMNISIWFVYADLVLISVATAFFRPSMFAVVPTIVTHNDILPANSFFFAMDTGTEVVGPAIAGLFALKYGYAPLLYLDAATYAFSALCVLGTRISHGNRVPGRRVVWRTVVEGVSEGLNYIRRDSLQWALFILIFPAYLVGSGLNALQTPLAKGVVGITDAEFGTFNSVWAIGFLVASLVLGWFGGRANKSYLIIGGFFLQYIAAAVLGFSRTLEMLLLSGFAVGFANTLNYVGLTSVLMERTQQRVIGRVMATRQVALGAIRVLSPLAFGALGDVIGVRQSIWAMAAVGTVGTAAVVALSPALRRIDRAGGPGPQPKIWKSLVLSANPEFDGNQQARLNLATLAIIILTWLGIVVRHPRYGIGLLLAVLGTAYLGASLKGKFSRVATERVERMFGSFRRLVAKTGSRPKS